MTPLNAKRLGLALGPAFVLASCGLLEPRACTLEVAPSIVVSITDSITGEPMAADAHGFIRDGEFVDSLLVFEEDGSGVPLSRQAGPDRSGRYLVVLYHAGYEAWVVGSVEVEDGGCHVETVRLEARLAPLAENVTLAIGSPDRHVDEVVARVREVPPLLIVAFPSFGLHHVEEDPAVLQNGSGWVGRGTRDRRCQTAPREAGARARGAERSLDDRSDARGSTRGPHGARPARVSATTRPARHLPHRGARSGRSPAFRRLAHLTRGAHRHGVG